jgi:UDP-N-acetylglucosamine 2-epimerase (non-hydrolysing)
MNKKQTKIFLVAGARPNFMKIAPIAREMEKNGDAFDCKIVHTGQHYDHLMSDVFFQELGIDKPHYHLGVGGGTHGEQTARIMVAFEELCLEEYPDLILVVGDVDSTLACSIAAKKLLIPVGHVEAGLRSGDMSMPEEINRIVTDSISDDFFVTEKSGMENLKSEGKREDSIHFVGHVMIDNLYYQLDKINGADCRKFVSTPLKQKYPEYGVVTLHRPSNVDDPNVFASILDTLNIISNQIPLIFPTHPRTRKNLEAFGICLNGAMVLTEPLSYMDFLNLWKDARLVLTDSGGLQEETTALRVPCQTIRENTERPITVSAGSNTLVGTSPEKIFSEANRALNGGKRKSIIPELWDGHSAERIVKIIRDRGTEP